MMTSIREAAITRAVRVAAPADRPVERRNAPESGASAGVRGQIAGLQVRKADDGQPVGFSGYATITDTPYEMYDQFGPYMEVVERRAPELALAGEPDVNFVLNHGGVPFARTKSGTMILTAEDVPDGEYAGRAALKVEVPSLDLRMPSVQDTVYALERGDLDEMSFKFRITSGSWSPDFETYTISQFDINRGDVSVVNYGANPYTSASLRAVDVSRLSTAELRTLLDEREQAEAAARDAVSRSGGQGLTAMQLEALALDLRA